MSSLDILSIPAMTDNYIFLLRDHATGTTAVVDPSASRPVLDALASRGWRLDHVLVTHHHWDHTGGNIELKEATGCQVVGSIRDAERIPGIDIAVEDGEHYAIGEARARVLAVPGHTHGHIAYWFPEAAAVFCGDTLFASGCGRICEGTADEMWHSLRRLRDLPEETLVYCGHEYTLCNLQFAVTVDPDNPALRERLAEVEALRRRRRPTVPSSIGVERVANPFLRADTEAMRLALGMPEEAGPVEVFAEIRKRKDNF